MAPTSLPGVARTETLTIPVGVFANNAKAKIALEARDFKIFVDDKEVEIVSVETRNEPLNVILLIDTSPSADTQLKTAKALALRIVEKLEPDDKVMVLGFNQELKTYTQLTSDRKELAKGIGRLSMGSGTSLYNAIARIFEKELANMHGPTVLLVVTDGVDTTSTKASYESSLIAAEKTNTTVFPIYFDTFAASQSRTLSGRVLVGVPSGLILPGVIGSPIRNARGTLKEEYELGRSYLTDLVFLSGGRPVRGDELAPGKMESLDSIPAEIKSRYYLTFRLASGGKPGDRHRIKVRVNKPDLTVLAKGSYIEQ